MQTWQNEKKNWTFTTFCEREKFMEVWRQRYHEERNCRLKWKRILDTLADADTLAEDSKVKVRLPYHKNLEEIVTKNIFYVGQWSAIWPLSSGPLELIGRNVTEIHRTKISGESPNLRVRSAEKWHKALRSSCSTFAPISPTNSPSGLVSSFHGKNYQAYLFGEASVLKLRGNMRRLNDRFFVKVSDWQECKWMNFRKLKDSNFFY